MRLLLLFIVASLSIVSAQSNFEKEMTKAFELRQSNQEVEALQMFDSIAKTNPKEWLPHYYIAQMNSLKSWGVKDVGVLKAQLKKAQSHLDQAMSLSPDNTELLVMQAQILTNWVAYDGMTYGRKYSGIITQLYNKATTLDPTNPRAAFCKADWAMGSAKYFGRDTAPFCKDVKEALTLFDSFKPESDFHPNWGRERAEQVLVSCNKE